VVKVDRHRVHVDPFLTISAAQNASLLPLLTLSKPEAGSFLGALDQVLV